MLVIDARASIAIVVVARSDEKAINTSPVLLLLPLLLANASTCASSLAHTINRRADIVTSVSIDEACDDDDEDDDAAAAAAAAAAADDDDDDDDDDVYDRLGDEATRVVADDACDDDDDDDRDDAAVVVASRKKRSNRSIDSTRLANDDRSTMSDARDNFKP